ncbi:class I SAM-dependent methyltransferase [Candidatus Thorarchaeota archaeon]|nr:MAG: class I SAM-dependent methyltransferase [Candidatus Thorarchaeota archaeon]
MSHHNLAKADWSDRERIERMAASYSRRYDILFWNALDNLTGTSPRKVVIDFGCGPGLFLNDAAVKYSAEKIIGLDESPEMLEYAQRLIEERSLVEDFELIQIDFDNTRIPLEPNIVELAFCGFMLHELRNPQDFVSQVANILKSGGSYIVYDYVSGDEDAFVIAMAARGMDDEHARMRYPHMCKHSIDDIVRLMTNAGLSDVKAIGVNDIRAVVIGTK